MTVKLKNILEIFLIESFNFNCTIRSTFSICSIVFLFSQKKGYLILFFFSKYKSGIELSDRCLQFFLRSLSFCYQYFQHYFSNKPELSAGIYPSIDLTHFHTFFNKTRFKPTTIDLESNLLANHQTRLKQTRLELVFTILSYVVFCLFVC